MKHPYTIGCECHRCIKEGGRRELQASQARFYAQPMRRKDVRRIKARIASREEQHGRYLDCGPQNWDDKDGGE